MSEPIRGGYILKARCIEDSPIAHAPPHVREIWDYFLRCAFFRDGKHLKRGELSSGYIEICEALHWRVGWRKQRYSKSKCETAMKYLKSAGMITTRRTTGGFIVTVCNYGHYQTPENYESREETATATTGKPRPPDTTEKKSYNNKEKEEREASAPSKFYNYWKQFTEIHSECSRVSEIRFVAALRACAVDQTPAVIESALADFGRHYADCTTFKPKSPLGVFESYLKAALNPPGGVRNPSGGVDPRIIDSVFVRPRRPQFD